MTSATNIAPVQPETDEDGKLRPLTADQCVAEFTQLAVENPAARFMVIAIAPNGWDSVELGWGLALPDHVFVHLPGIPLSGDFRTADRLLHILGRTMDARLIWVDPEPEHWPEEPAG